MGENIKESKPRQLRFDTGCKIVLIFPHYVDVFGMFLIPNWAFQRLVFPKKINRIHWIWHYDLNLFIGLKILMSVFHLKSLTLKIRQSSTNYTALVYGQNHMSVYLSVMMTLFVTGNNVSLCLLVCLSMDNESEFSIQSTPAQ